MALSILDDRSQLPDRQQLDGVLGSSVALWNEIAERLAVDEGAASTEWKFTGAKYGWSMRIKRKDRVILYLIPQAGHFLVGVVLGERAVRAAHESGLPKDVLDEIDGARAYAEGRGIRLPVKRRQDVAVVLALARVKLAN